MTDVDVFTETLRWFVWIVAALAVIVFLILGLRRKR